MTKHSRSGGGDLATLLAERQKYEAWIAALEARRDLTPEHVFERVHSDYHGRLQSVMLQLAEHTRELQERIELLAARLAKIETDQQSRFDERAELEVRCAVGELSEAAFEAAARDCDQATAALSAHAQTVRAEMESARDALGAGAGRVSEGTPAEARPAEASSASPPANVTPPSPPRKTGRASTSWRS